MIRPAADETITRDGRPLGQAVTSYVADGPALYICEVKSLQWQRLQGLQDEGREGMMASPPPWRRRWLLEGAGAAFQLPFSTVLTEPPRSRMTKMSTVPYTYEPGMIARLLGAVLEAAHAYGGLHVWLLRK